MRRVGGPLGHKRPWTVKCPLASRLWTRPVAPGYKARDRQAPPRAVRRAAKLAIQRKALAKGVRLSQSGFPHPSRTVPHPIKTFKHFPTRGNPLTENRPQANVAAPNRPHDRSGRVNTWESYFTTKSRRRSLRKWRDRAMKAAILTLFFGSLATALFLLVEGLPS